MPTMWAAILLPGAAQEALRQMPRAFYSTGEGEGGDTRMTTIDDILKRCNEHELRAWKAFARYKLLMGGYHACWWVQLNQLFPRGLKKPNAFRELIDLARRKEEELSS